MILKEDKMSKSDQETTDKPMVEVMYPFFS